MGPKWVGVEVGVSGGGRRLKLPVRANRRIGNEFEVNVVCEIVYVCV